MAKTRGRQFKRFRTILSVSTEGFFLLTFTDVDNQEYLVVFTAEDGQEYLAVGDI